MTRVVVSAVCSRIPGGEGMITRSSHSTNDNTHLFGNSWWPVRCSSHPIESESCLCIRLKELDSFWNNLELEEHKRVLLSSFKNVKTISDSGGKGLVTYTQGQDGTASPYDYCPVLHFEGLWISLSSAFSKKGCLPHEGKKKSPAALKPKIGGNPKVVVKTKKVRTSGPKVAPSKTSDFVHNIPVEKMLKVYRDENIYSKLHMRRVDKVAIKNAIMSSNYKQTPVPAVVIEPRLEMPQMACAQVVNISFHRGLKSARQESLKYHESKDVYERKKPSSVQLGVKRAHFNHLTLESSKCSHEVAITSGDEVKTSFG
ncbi:uncharacterized protein LOC124167368 isoform X2 [Ischnura elegans]|uniref:uncharacterized protein LOC124167368 isoform X2 n=1 Tax=Ischnura elegans TaxID=197161 RepID=UPI001ED88460|nr:uncharacterized protein LOC124167368 isoform X2 [Ischnura elegans]